MSRSEEAHKETKLDKDILRSYTVLFASLYKILNFFPSEPIT